MALILIICFIPLLPTRPCSNHVPCVDSNSLYLPRILSASISSTNDGLAWWSFATKLLKLVPTIGRRRMQTAWKRKYQIWSWCWAFGSAGILKKLLNMSRSASTEHRTGKQWEVSQFWIIPMFLYWSYALSHQGTVSLYRYVFSFCHWLLRWSSWSFVIYLISYENLPSSYKTVLHWERTSKQFQRS